MHYCDDLETPTEAQEERARERRYRQDMESYPHCRDPDHPGCPNCGHSED